jgi:hypothetical protein
VSTMPTIGMFCNQATAIFLHAVSVYSGGKVKSLTPM